MRTPRLHWRLGRAISGTMFSFVVVVAGMGASELEEQQEEGALDDEVEQISNPSQVTGCPNEGFDICFPNPLFPAPNTMRCDEPSAPPPVPVVEDCLASVCSGVSSEPEPQFFSRCCFQGGAADYELGCVEIVQEHCSGLAEFCAEHCPSFDVLSSDATLSALNRGCLPEYPQIVADVCELDPFCCNTQWDELCAGELFDLRFGP